MEEIRTPTKKLFVTLTFNNESIYDLGQEVGEDVKGYDRDNAIATLGVRRFLENWRRRHKKSIRHWFVTELGHQGTENIHIHGILFLPEGMTEKEGTRELKEKWRYGYVGVGLWVNEQTVNYIIKYIHKPDFDHKYYKSITLTSSGIGNQYTKRPQHKLNQYNPNGQTKDYYHTRSGTKIALPIYLRNKLYTEEEREKLWIEKLETKKRYVMGTEIDISKGLETYLAHLKLAQELNTKLKYGSNATNWEQLEYETQARELNYKKRTEEISKSLEILFIDEETGEVFAEAEIDEVANDSLLDVPW